MAGMQDTDSLQEKEASQINEPIHSKNCSQLQNRHISSEADNTLLGGPCQSCELVFNVSVSREIRQLQYTIALSPH